MSDEVEKNAERIRTALRKLDALDPETQAAGEALGFFIFKARGGLAADVPPPSRCPRCEGYEATYHTFEGECSAARLDGNQP